jgi:hypothetical protein
MAWSRAFDPFPIGFSGTAAPAVRYGLPMPRQARPEPMPFWAGCIIILLGWLVLRLAWVQ